MGIKNSLASFFPYYTQFLFGHTHTISFCVSSSKLSVNICIISFNNNTDCLFISAMYFLNQFAVFHSVFSNHKTSYILYNHYKVKKVHCKFFFNIFCHSCSINHNNLLNSIFCNLLYYYFPSQRLCYVQANNYNLFLRLVCHVLKNIKCTLTFHKEAASQMSKLLPGN